MGLYGDADLVMTRDVGYSRTLQYLLNGSPIDWTLYTIKSEIRDRDDTLLFTLTPYFSPLSTDHTTLNLQIPAAIVKTVPHDTKWDLLATRISDGTVIRTPSPPGRVLVLPGVTHA